MSGTIALHGGGEFLAGDEPFLREILALAPRWDGPVRIAVVPTAAARGRPALAAANGVEAFTRLAAAAEVPVQAVAVMVVDAASAADEELAATLAAANLIHLPGGDPDLIPALYPGTRAWNAIREAVAGGTVLAGASAGAMALAEVTWTPGGLVAGLGLVPGIVVVPHADGHSWAQNLVRFGGDAPGAIGILGLGERTAVLVRDDDPWRVVGEGEVRWLPPGVHDVPGALDPGAAVILRDGDTFVPARA